MRGVTEILQYVAIQGKEEALTSSRLLSLQNEIGQSMKKLGGVEVKGGDSGQPVGWVVKRKGWKNQTAKKREISERERTFTAVCGCEKLLPQTEVSVPPPIPEYDPAPQALTGPRPGPGGCDRAALPVWVRNRCRSIYHDCPPSHLAFPPTYHIALSFLLCIGSSPTSTYARHDIRIDHNQGDTTRIAWVQYGMLYFTLAIPPNVAYSIVTIGPWLHE